MVFRRRFDRICSRRQWRERHLLQGGEFTYGRLRRERRAEVSREDTRRRHLEAGSRTKRPERSTVRLLLAGAALFGLLAAAPSPVPRYPHAFATDLGLTKLIGETDADAPVTGVQIFVAAGLDRESPSKNGVSALVAECLFRTPVATPGGASPTPLREAIIENGGTITYTVDGRSVHYYLEGQPENLAVLVGLFAKALAAPDFTPATIAAARAALVARDAEFEGNALSVGIEMFRHSYYATGAGDPALGSSTTLAALSSHDVEAFFQATYKRSAISASAAGQSAPGLGEAVQALAAELPDGPVIAVNERARPIPALAPRIVAHRDISAPWVIVGFAAPPPNSRDFGAMLVLESLLSGTFERTSATTLGFVEKSVGAFYLY